MIIKRLITIGSVACAMLLTVVQIQAAPQSIVFDFEDGTDQGWGNAFSADPNDAVMLPIEFISGSNRLGVIRDGSFQEVSRRNADGDVNDPFFNLMGVVASNEADFNVSFDYYIDTAVSDGNFLQLGAFMNDGSGAYAQVESLVELGGGELASGDVFAGTISSSLADFGFDYVEGQSAYEFGFIVNGDGNQTVWIDNVSIASSAIPEPGSFGVLAILGLAGLRRRVR